MDNFIHIAKTGVPIVLYVDQEIREVYKTEWQSFDNVVLRDVDYSKSWTYKVCSLYKNNLPASRNMVKDSFLFLCLMNMKIEFVGDALSVGAALSTVGDSVALERFIYRWAPFEIGELVGDTLKIIKSIPVEHMLLQKIRGSTPPV